MTQHRLSACSVLLRKSQQSITGFEFYLVRRAATLEFMGGFQVFPGGKVDPSDHEVQIQGLEQHQAIYCCAARELLEETGVLIARGPNQSADKISSMRQSLLEQTKTWNDILEENGLNLHADDFINLGRWVTPPYTPVRFDALYLASWLPEAQEPSIIHGELTEGIWLTPEQAIADHNAGKAQTLIPFWKHFEK